MSDRMELMKKLQEQNPKSYCPSCGSPNKCAMELGKSANTCWCMTEEGKTEGELFDYDICLCHNCLKEER